MDMDIVGRAVGITPATHLEALRNSQLEYLGSLQLWRWIPVSVLQ
jgi:hypothetical protein